MKEGLEKKRPAEGPPPVEPKRVKFQHPGTKEEHEGTEMERDQKMAQWWAEIAAASANSGSVTGNPGQQMPPPGLAPPSGTPMTCRVTAVCRSRRMDFHHHSHRDITMVLLLLWGRCLIRTCPLQRV